MDEIETKLLLSKIMLLANISASATISLECKVKPQEDVQRYKANVLALEKSVYQLELLFGKNRDTLLFENSTVLKDLTTIEENLKDLKEQ
jgi:hypothetical protein